MSQFGHALICFRVLLWVCGIVERRLDLKPRSVYSEGQSLEMASSVKPKPVKKKWLHLGSGLGPVWHSLCQNGFTNEVKAGKAKKEKKKEEATLVKSKLVKLKKIIFA